MNRFDVQETVLPYRTPEFSRLVSETPARTGEFSRIITRQRELIVSWLVGRQHANTRIVNRQVPEPMKHVFWIRIDGTCNLFGGFSGAGTELLAHLLLKL